LMYVLVFFLPLLSLFFSHPWQTIVAWSVAWVMGIATIARGFLVWVSAWFVSLMVSYTSRTVRWVMMGAIVFAVVCVWVVSVSRLKYWSTIERLHRWQESVHLLGESPWIGYGLGMSGPGYFWGWLVVPENLYLQVMLDLWLVWFVGRIVLRCACVFAIKRFVSYDIWRARCGGLLALAAVWLVLHPCEDATVNMVIFGMGTWMIVWQSRYQQTCASKQESCGY
jgi:hypothetical protein